MINRMSAFSAIACLALSGAALAQTTAEEDNPVAAIESDLSLGEDTSTPEIGQTYIREEVQDWEIQCVRVEEGNEEPCQMYQLLEDSEGNPVAEVSIFRLPSGGQAIAGATVIVPLETSLQAQLRVAVDGAQSKRYPFAVCNPIGCIARIGLTQPDVNGFKRGAAATVTIVPFLAPDQKVELTMSLKGFTAGLEKSTVVTQ